MNSRNFPGQPCTEQQVREMRDDPSDVFTVEERVAAHRQCQLRYDAAQRSRDDGRLDE